MLLSVSLLPLVADLFSSTASRTLHQYTLPFVAFVAIQPPGAGAPSTSPTMQVISRLEGSPSSSTSAAALLTQLNTIVLPRVRPFLTRLRGERETRLAERRLREEQDRAYQAAARKDEERVLKARAEEGRRKRDKEEREEKERQAAKLREGAGRWRAWMRGVLEKGEPGESEEGVARVGVRLGDGRRAVRRFGKGEKVERVYAFVECALEIDDGQRLSASISLLPLSALLTLCTNSLSANGLPAYLRLPPGDDVPSSSARCRR